MRKLLLAAGLLLSLLCPASAQQTMCCFTNIPSWVPNPSNPPDIAINWTLNQAWTPAGGITSPAALGITTTRASAETTLLPTSASGAAYVSYPSNTTAVSSLGRQTYEARTNFLLNSTAPVTQTTGTLANGTYTLWVNGTGSATISSGTATGCGTSAATNGSPISFTLSGTTGTCTVTVAGSLNAFQLELNPGSVSAPTPLIITAGSTGTRAADVTTLTGLTFGSSYTLFEQATPQAPSAYGSNQFLLQVDDNSNNNKFVLGRATASGNAVYFTTSGGVTSTGSSGVQFAQSASGKLAASTVAGAQSGSFNGGAPFALTAAQPALVSNVRFGSNSAGLSSADGLAAIDAIWLTQAVPSAQLQSMTQ